jgi:acetyltransferase-like isoleucine patch superfamily enzyme
MRKGVDASRRANVVDRLRPSSVNYRAGRISGSSRFAYGSVILPISPNVILGSNVVLYHKDLVNLLRMPHRRRDQNWDVCRNSKNSVVGERCKISSHSFICEGVEIADEVFVGHGVMFTNDSYPRATTIKGLVQAEADWRVLPTRVRRRASIGSNATILPGITIGENAMIGAGAVVTRDVPDYAVAVGVPARIVGDTRTDEALAAQG